MIFEYKNPRVCCATHYLFSVQLFVLEIFLT
nr:MAG TPA: protein of unknown function (DUF4629) [Bacteriophage sp.]